LANEDSDSSNTDLYHDPDLEFKEIFEEAYMDPNSVWDRGKISNRPPPRAIPDDTAYLRRLETTVTNIESFLESLPNQDTSLSSHNTHSLILSLHSNSQQQDDTLSDVDLDKFDTTKKPKSEVHLESISSAIADRADTASLSDFHNVRDVLLNIQERLECFLRGSQQNVNDVESPTNLEGNITDLKRELERYVHVINEKKENELRKFSENMVKNDNIVQMKKAFMRKEKLKTNVYETLSSMPRYALANQASLPPSIKSVSDIVQMNDGFTMRSRYENCSSDFSSVEYYSMIINEERSEKLLNDAPQPRYHEREKISLIFRDPENVIKQWQNYQLQTIHIKPKKEKTFKLKWKKSPKFKPQDVWGFTLDSYQNRNLQEKLAEERRLRSICRIFFYFFSIVAFVLIVMIVQSVFTLKRSGNLD
jgi:hypothetical protein